MMRDKAKMVQADAMFGFEREDIGVDLFGGEVAAGAETFERQLQGTAEGTAKARPQAASSAIFSAALCRAVDLPSPGIFTIALAALHGSEHND